MTENPAPKTFTTAVHFDGTAFPATPPHYFETAERGVLDVQAVLGAGDDGEDFIHVGDVALSLTGARDLAAHLLGIVGALDTAGDGRDLSPEQAAWVALHGLPTETGGDVCGCPDPRCIGHHRDVSADDCGCVRALSGDL